MLVVACDQEAVSSPEPDETSWEAAAAMLTGDPSRGAALVEVRACTTCHTTEPGLPSTGPTFVDYFGSNVYLEDGGEVLADAAHIKQSILRPLDTITEGYQPTMPSYEGQLTDQEIADIVAFLETLASP